MVRPFRVISVETCRNRSFANGTIAAFLRRVEPNATDPGYGFIFDFCLDYAMLRLTMHSNRLHRAARRSFAMRVTSRLLSWLAPFVLLCESLGDLQLAYGQSAPAALPNLELSTGGHVNAVAVQPDGKVVIGGFFNWVNGVARNNLARINTDGTVDEKWNPEPDRLIHILVATPDAVFAAGSFALIGGQPRNALAKLNSVTGEADALWNPSPPDEPVEIHCTTYYGTRLYVGGAFQRMGGVNLVSIARLDTAGPGDADFFWNHTSLRNVVLNASTVLVASYLRR